VGAWVCGYACGKLGLFVRDLSQTFVGIGDIDQMGRGCGWWGRRCGCKCGCGCSQVGSFVGDVSLMFWGIRDIDQMVRVCRCVGVWVCGCVGMGVGVGVVWYSGFLGG